MTTQSELVETALSLINSAHAEGIECRLFGSLGVEYYVGANCFASRPARPKDIDLVSKSSFRGAMQHLLQRLDWCLDKSLLLLADKRETYHKRGTRYTLDLYYDEIDGNHPISLRDRLTIAYPVMPVIDLLLTKLQRVSLRREDKWDICALLKLDKQDGALTYFTTMVAANWCLYTTVTDNLRSCLEDGCNARYLLTEAEVSPKTLGWRLRSIVGRRWRWWREVYGASAAIDDQTWHDEA